MSERADLIRGLFAPGVATQAFVEHLIDKAGLTRVGSAQASDGHIDPFKVEGQRAIRVFALELLADIGWSLRPEPPASLKAAPQGGVRSALSPGDPA